MLASFFKRSFIHSYIFERARGEMDITSDYGSLVRGSNPRGRAIQKKPLLTEAVFFCRNSGKKARGRQILSAFAFREERFPSLFLG